MVGVENPLERMNEEGLAYIVSLFLFLFIVVFLYLHHWRSFGRYRVRKSRLNLEVEFVLRRYFSMEDRM